MEITNVIILSVMFAVFMKISYSISEGNLKVFKGGGVLFGFLWGMAGSYLILYDNTLANVWMAVLVGWVLRSKMNHFPNAMAGTMMLLTFFLNNNNFIFQRSPFLTFFYGVLLIGLPHEYLSRRGVVCRAKSELFQSIFFYTLLPLGYSLITKNWLVFASMFSFMLVYELTRKLTQPKTKHVAKKRAVSFDHNLHPAKRRL